MCVYNALQNTGGSARHHVTRAGRDGTCLGALTMPIVPNNFGKIYKHNHTIISNGFFIEPLDPIPGAG